MSSGATAEARRTARDAPVDEGARRPGGTIVVGLGNPLLGDDGVGWRVADEVERRFGGHPRAPTVEIDRQCVGGLGLMERLVGYRRAILVDAIVSAAGRPGVTWARPLADVDPGSAGHLDSAHDASLATALEAGHALGAPLPRRVDVVGVEAHAVDTFGERLSPSVESAVARAADLVLELLEDES